MNSKNKNRKYLLWGIGNAGEGMVAMVASTYFSIYLTDVALLPLGVFTFVSLFTSVFALVMVPVAGAILVSVTRLKWGRFRSWLILLPPIAVLFYVLTFTPIPNNTILTTILVLIGFCGSAACWNVVYASNVSLMAELTLNKNLKNELTSQRMIGSSGGRMLGNYLTPLIVAAVALNSSEAAGYRVAILVMGVIYIATNWIHFKISEGSEIKLDKGSGTEQIAENNEDETMQKLSFIEIIKALVANPQLLVTLLIDTTSNIAGIVLPSLAVYYYKYVAQDMTMVAGHMLTIGFGGMIGAFMVRSFGHKVKQYRKFLLVLYCIIPVMLFSHRFVAGTPILFMSLAGIMSVMTGMTQPFETNLYLDNIVAYKERTGKDATGFIMGCMNLTVKFSTLIKGTLIPLALIAVGYVANAEPTPELQQAIVNAYTIVPIVFPVMGFILLKFFYKLRDCRQDME